MINIKFGDGGVFIFIETIYLIFAKPAISDIAAEP
jgi:hypothetical protein